MTTHDPTPAMGGETAPAWSELILEFDAAQSQLMLAYSRYIERPSEARLGAIHEAADTVTDAFSDVVQRMIDGNEALFGSLEERLKQFATMIVSLDQAHTELLLDYKGPIHPYKPDDYEQKRRTLVECFLENSLERADLLAHVMDHFKEVLESDWAGIEVTIEKRENRLLSGKNLTHFGFDIVKLTATAALGAAIANRFRSRGD